MKKRRVKRYSKVSRAINYIRDIGRGYVTVYDPESLRQACFTVANYIEILELNATDGAKRNAALDTESTLIRDAAKRGAALQFTLLTERTPDNDHNETA